jgi:hypothetical protein
LPHCWRAPPSSPSGRRKTRSEEGRTSDPEGEVTMIQIPGDLTGPEADLLRAVLDGTSRRADSTRQPTEQG